MAGSRAAYFASAKQQTSGVNAEAAEFSAGRVNTRSTGLAPFGSPKPVDLRESHDATSSKIFGVCVTLDGKLIPLTNHAVLLTGGWLV